MIPPTNKEQALVRIHISSLQHTNKPLHVTIFSGSAQSEERRLVLNLRKSCFDKYLDGESGEKGPLYKYRNDPAKPKTHCTNVAQIDADAMTKAVFKLQEATMSEDKKSCMSPEQVHRSFNVIQTLNSTFLIKVFRRLSFQIHSRCNQHGSKKSQQREKKKRVITVRACVGICCSYNCTLYLYRRLGKPTPEVKGKTSSTKKGKKKSKDKKKKGKKDKGKKDPKPASSDDSDSSESESSASDSESTSEEENQKEEKGSKKKGAGVVPLKRIPKEDRENADTLLKAGNRIALEVSTGKDKNGIELRKQVGTGTPVMTHEVIDKVRFTTLNFSHLSHSVSIHLRANRSCSWS